MLCPLGSRTNIQSIDPSIKRLINHWINKDTVIVVLTGYNAQDIKVSRHTIKIETKIVVSLNRSRHESGRSASVSFLILWAREAEDSGETPRSSVTDFVFAADVTCGFTPHSSVIDLCDGHNLWLNTILIHYRPWRMSRRSYDLRYLALFCFCVVNAIFLYNFVDFRIDATSGTSQDKKQVNQKGLQRPMFKKMMYVNPRPEVKSEHTFNKCNYSACVMTTSVEEADVLFFNAARMEGVVLPTRRANQIWVMYSREPPDLPRFDHLKRDDLLNQVNFSRMILGDSTWQNKYGNLHKRPVPKKDYKKIFRQKKYEAAWFVSQCNRPSRRMEYVRRMARWVDVHIYGQCGNYTCGQKGYSMGNQKAECLKLLTKNYKFYLSFENTFCRDYVSEKFFNIFEDVDTVPVARGGADYKRLFPSGVFVDSSDFKSPESLGKYLHALARDEKKYVEILQEKNKYTWSGYHPNFACDLCQIAHTGSPRHVYKDFYSWVRAPGNCWEPRDLD
ncbi:hypothetical protein RRG08_051574 [Elysia crispata]|uniref:Fucosyltransferase n=1 Tax=Elysia crispata TaxID=231223 RepID=A0AAE0ZGW1_9GAST|nr:hypothetical protein RRG08_051574 [Elysia crispata]